MGNLGFRQAGLMGALSGAVQGGIGAAKLDIEQERYATEQQRLADEAQRAKNKDTLELAKTLSMAGKTKEAAEILNANKKELGLAMGPDGETTLGNITDFDIRQPENRAIQLDDGTVIRYDQKSEKWDYLRDDKGNIIKHPDPTKTGKATEQALDNLNKALLAEGRNMNMALAPFGKGSELQTTGNTMEDFARAFASIGKSEAYAKAVEAASDPANPQYSEAQKALTEIRRIRETISKQVRSTFNIDEKEFQKAVKDATNQGIDKEFSPDKPVPVPLGAQPTTKGASLGKAGPQKGYPPDIGPEEIQKAIDGDPVFKEFFPKLNSEMEKRHAAWTMYYLINDKDVDRERALDRAIRAARKRIGYKE